MNTGDWTAVGAMATAVMAIATFILALNTRSMSRATEKMVSETKTVSEATLKEAQAVEQQTGHIEQQVKVSSDALRASVQPWFTWVPVFEEPMVTVSASGVRKTARILPGLNIEQVGDDIAGYLVVKNIGTGIALVNLNQSSIFNANDSHIPFGGIHPFMESPVIPPGVEATIEFKIPGTKGANKQKITLLEFVGGENNGTMHIELIYSDILGAITAKARFQAYRKALPNGKPGAWKVIETTYSQDGREPIIVRSV